MLGQLPSVEVTREIGLRTACDCAGFPAYCRVGPNCGWLGIGPADLDEEARKQAARLSRSLPCWKNVIRCSEGVTLDGIVWGGVGTLDQDLTPIVSAGKRFLLALDQRTSARTYLLNIDLSRSNLQDSPDWPILISNLVELRRDNLPGLRRWNYRLQDEIRFRLFEAGTDEALHAGERELTLRHGENRSPLGPHQPGGDSSVAGNRHLRGPLRRGNPSGVSRSICLMNTNRNWPIWRPVSVPTQTIPPRNCSNSTNLSVG